MKVLMTIGEKDDGVTVMEERSGAVWLETTQGGVRLSARELLRLAGLLAGVGLAKLLGATNK